MSSSNPIHDDDDDQGDVFIDESDIVDEVTIDEEDLPDAEDDTAFDAESDDGVDDSMHIFTGHTGHPYHTAGLRCLALSSDSTLCITGSEDSSVHVVNITTGRVVSSLVSHSESVECVAVSPSNPWAATGSMDQKLIIWDLQHSSARSTCEHEDGVSCMTWLGKSKYIATGCLEGKLRVWDSLSGDCVTTFSGHAGAIQSLSLSANLDFLVSASIDGTARVFEIADFRCRLSEKSRQRSLFVP